MAEQKSEDTKQSLARRGARPFAGPAAGASSAARPLVRPPTPGQRPVPAPFAPPAVPARPALGAQATQSAPLAPAPAMAPLPLEVPAAAIAAAPVDEAPVRGSTVSETEAMQPIASAVPVEVAPPTRARPITSEMVALDAIDAFDALWATASDDAPASAAATTSPAPLDEASLGMLDASSMWSEEIAGAVEEGAAPVEEVETPARAAADLEMPAWLADDYSPAAPEAVSEQPVGGLAMPSPGEATPTGALEGTDVVAAEPTDVPVADVYSLHAPSTTSSEVRAEAEAEAEASAFDEGSVQTADGHASTAVSPSLGAQHTRFELVEEPTTTERAPQGLGDSSESVATRDSSHVSAALDRLARRVRAGEIDVSSIAPEATDAAMLASVLAALLGGSSSR